MAYYDIEALSYDDWYQKPIGKFIDKLQTQLVFEKLQPKPGMKILDVGCGTGNYSIKLAELGCIVTGIDVSTGMLEKARAKIGTLSVVFKLMSSSALEFVDKSFDAVLSVTAFEFIDDCQQTFNEMLRVAKNGAPIVVGTLHKNSAWGTLYESNELRANSIFKYANLKSIKDLQNFAPDNFISVDECLHINPTFVEADFTVENEAKLKTENPGGFICGLWEK